MTNRDIVCRPRQWIKSPTMVEYTATPRISIGAWIFLVSPIIWTEPARVTLRKPMSWLLLPCLHQYTLTQPMSWLPLIVSSSCQGYNLRVLFHQNQRHFLHLLLHHIQHNRTVLNPKELPTHLLAQLLRPSRNPRMHVQKGILKDIGCGIFRKCWTGFRTVNELSNMPIQQISGVLYAEQSCNESLSGASTPSLLRLIPVGNSGRSLISH